jgi:hydroxyacylglutathione hydrolase
VPTTIAREKATNPFLKAGSAQAFAAVRSAKDNFKG